MELFHLDLKRHIARWRSSSKCYSQHSHPFYQTSWFNPDQPIIKSIVDTMAQDGFVDISQHEFHDKDGALRKITVSKKF